METVRTTMNLRCELHEAAKAAAAQRRMSLVTWVEHAVVAQLNREARYAKISQRRAKAWPSGWPKAKACYKCQKKHDPQEHPNEDLATIRGVMEFEEEG